MKDAVDRIEKKQDNHNGLLETHIKEASEESRTTNERLVRLETIFEYALKRDGDMNGPG